MDLLTGHISCPGNVDLFVSFKICSLIIFQNVYKVCANKIMINFTFQFLFYLYCVCFGSLATNWKLALLWNCFLLIIQTCCILGFHLHIFCYKNYLRSSSNTILSVLLMVTFPEISILDIIQILCEWKCSIGEILLFTA